MCKASRLKSNLSMWKLQQQATSGIEDKGESGHMDPARGGAICRVTRNWLLEQREWRAGPWSFFSRGSAFICIRQTCRIYSWPRP